MPHQWEEERGFPEEVMLQLMVREVRYNHRDEEKGNQSMKRQGSVCLCVCVSICVSLCVCVCVCLCVCMCVSY